ncbi:MAG: HD domain-containing protein [Acidimicrobiales bacterium]
MEGYSEDSSKVRQAHRGASRITITPAACFDREAREAQEEVDLARGATLSGGPERRLHEEEPDPLRTRFERDRDRILHSPAFRRLAGKTQVFVFPADHQRTRLTHALEVAQVATAISRACRLNVPLTEAIALGHDCGHGPGGHASEDAFSVFVEGFDHAVWGADVTSAPLNLCAETLDGIRNHSWSRPAPSTPEGQVVGLADRIAYCAHDLEDAASAGVVSYRDLPDVVLQRCGPTRSTQLHSFVTDAVEVLQRTGLVGLSDPMGDALASMREFNHERIYLTEASKRQARSVVAMLRALVEHFVAAPHKLPAGRPAQANPGESRDPNTALPDMAACADTVSAAVGWVGGMTDRYACRCALELLDWDPSQLPKGYDVG